MVPLQKVTVIQQQVVTILMQKVFIQQQMGTIPMQKAMDVLQMVLTFKFTTIHGAKLLVGKSLSTVMVQFVVFTLDIVYFV